MLPFSQPFFYVATARGRDELGTRLVMKYVLSGWFDDNESLGFHNETFIGIASRFISIERQTK